MLTSTDLGLAYHYILDNFVDQVDYTRLIDAASGALRESVGSSGALPVDLAPLDLLPLPTGNADRDWSAFGSSFDAVIQRRPEWSVQARPDYQAMRKMLETLDDNHSNFLTADEARRRTESNYSGIGVRMARPEPQSAPTVVEVFASGPAAVAGMRVGDRIVAVNDRPVAQAQLSEVADLIRGPQGTEVTIQVERTAAGGPLTLRAFRRPIETPVAEGKLEGRVGYLKIWAFTETTAERVGRILLEQGGRDGQAAGAQGALGWIIDLRGNPGGNLQAVQRVAGYFLENRPIGIQVDRSGQREALFAEQRPFRVRQQVPIVILIDGQSGSGSEVLSASFREYQLATLVGQTSAGSVGIAQTRPLSDGSVIQVTVRRLLTPSGAAIDEVGVQPDEVVPLTAEDLEAGRDPQLERAFQIIRQRVPGA